MTRIDRLTQALATVEQLRTRVTNLQGEVDAAVRELRVVKVELDALVREEPRS